MLFHLRLRPRVAHALALPTPAPTPQLTFQCVLGGGVNPPSFTNMALATMRRSNVSPPFAPRKRARALYIPSLPCLPSLPPLYLTCFCNYTILSVLCLRLFLPHA